MCDLLDARERIVRWCGSGRSGRLTKIRRIRQPIANTIVACVFMFGLAVKEGPAGVAAPTFTKNVAPILFKHCVGCHQPGEIASNTSFLTYNNVRPWAKSIREKVLRREMPPWPADPNGSVKFRNDARLSPEEITTVASWVNSGAAEGDDRDLPPLPRFPVGWLYPGGLPPDLVLSMPGEFAVPASGSIPYIRFLAKVPFSEDRWVSAIQVRPGNRAVVHHMAITEVQLQEGMKSADLDAFALLARRMGLPNTLPGARPAITAPGDSMSVDMLGVYTPGTTLEMYPGDRAKLVKGGKNSYINFNIHYQTIGRIEKDQSMIAFWFLAGPPKHQLFRVAGASKTIIANGSEMLSDTPGPKAEGTGAAIPPIPPYADNYEVTGITAYPEPITIFQFQPHAHVRCKDFTYIVVYPDGREQKVLTVPKYNFDWQLAYELETPLRLPAGSKLVVTAHYDNSRNNKYNPAPDRAVYFRDSENQSWDEMFTPFIQFSNDNQDLAMQRREQRARNVDAIVEVDGCLQQSREAWMLTSATTPIPSDTQETSSVALKAAAGRMLGSGEYRLLGAGFFNPSTHKEQKVAVKGVVIKATTGLNVTSLQTVGTSCAH